MDPTRRGDDAADFERVLRSNIVGQEQAITAVVEVFQTFQAGLNPPGRPLPMANLLASAQVRLGDVIRIDRTSSGDMVFTREPDARVAHEQEDYRIPNVSPVAAHGLAWM